MRNGFSGLNSRINRPEEKKSGSLKIVQQELPEWKCKENKTKQQQRKQNKNTKNRTECKRTVEQYQKIYQMHTWNARRRKKKEHQLKRYVK